ncbi:flagellin [Planosporangium sp. 12N6]|uniref:flagellin n=1 Tax=Planosporangium spinosum TaxID=3402278 RepID=UPI003CE8C755
MIGIVMSGGSGAVNALGRSAAAVRAVQAGLASGRRINSAADDAAGLSVSTDLTTRARGLTVAAKGVREVVDSLTAIDGAFGTVTGILQRLRELGVQAGNGALGPDGRAALDVEARQGLASIDAVLALRVSGRPVFTGQPGTAVPYQPAVVPVPPVPARAAVLTGSPFGAFAVGAPGGGTAPPAAAGDDLTVSTAGSTLTLHLAPDTYATAQDALSGVRTAWTAALAGADATTAAALAGVAFALTGSGALTVTAGDTGAASSVTVTGGATASLGLDNPTTTGGADAVPGVPGRPEVPAQREKPVRLYVQQGADAGDGFDAVIPLLDTRALGLAGWTPGQAGVDAIDSALAQVMSTRTTLGAQATALTRSAQVADVTADGLTAAAARMSDTDLGTATVQLALAQNRFSTGIAVLSTARAVHADLIERLVGGPGRRGSLLDLAV